MIGLDRWAYAVASAGTRAIAPPRTRSWATRIDASDASSRSTIVSASSRSTRFMNRFRAIGRRVVVRVLRRVDLRVAASGGPGPRAGVASARNGARARVGRPPGRPTRRPSSRITTSPWCSSGTNGIGGSGMTLAIVESSSGAASAAAMKPGDRLRASRAGSASRRRCPAARGAGTGTGSRRRSCRRRRGSPRTGPARARRRRDADRPVGGHDLGGEQAVDRQAVLADQVADAAADRDPADPDRAGVAEADREAVLDAAPS